MGDVTTISQFSNYTPTVHNASKCEEATASLETINRILMDNITKFRGIIIKKLCDDLCIYIKAQSDYERLIYVYTTIINSDYDSDGQDIVVVAKNTMALSVLLTHKNFSY